MAMAIMSLQLSNNNIDAFLSIFVKVIFVVHGDFEGITKKE